MESTEYHPFVSVVIPTFNRGYHLSKTIDSLFRQDYPKDRYEIIVVDNSSTDNTAEIISRLKESAPVEISYVIKEPAGPGPARNLGVSLSKGEILAFIDSDCIADARWLSEGGRKIRGDIGFVQGKTLPDPTVPWGIFSRSVIIERESFIYECCNIFYKKEAFLSVGGFSDVYYSVEAAARGKRYLGGEDLDLAHRVLRLGWKSAFSENAVVYHEVTKQTKWRWLVETQYLIWPLMAKRFPEIRRHFFLSHFLSRTRFLFAFAVAAIVGGFYHRAFLLLGIPYLVECSLSQPTVFWKGPLRIFRTLACFPRDAAAFIVLFWASIRHRTLLL